MNDNLNSISTLITQKKINKINAVQIGLASAEEIRSWSKGEVTKPETINYKSLKPEKNGLFDEAIFGPIKDYECACGKYKKVKYRGKKCERCGVDITESIVRREWMGHIDLACPVTHMWMIKELPLPSKISLILGMTYKEVEEVVYFQNYVVIDPGYLFNKDKKTSEQNKHDGLNLIFNKYEVLNLTDTKKSALVRSKLRRLLKRVLDKIIAEQPENKKSHEYQTGMSFYKQLKDSNLPFSINDMFDFLERYSGLKVGIGSEAIETLLKEIDVHKVEEQLENLLRQNEYSDYTDNKTKRVLRRLSVIRWLKNSNNKPEWMVLRTIPVIPPDLRPIIQLEGGRFTTSDINTFYRRIIIRNERLKRIIELNAAPVIIHNEKRMLQDAVDSLIDNSARKKPLVTKDKHALKSLTEDLKGKQGLFRQNLLGKRVDYSGRSVIVIGPQLKMYEVGLPIVMILKLFKPFIIRELIANRDKYGNEIKPIVNSIKAAEKLILYQDNKIWPIVHQVIKERPVLLNRAPTLHRLGIQAFEPKLVEGKAIQLHPLVTPAFNADFDGDQMAVHIPITDVAIAEARSILLAPWNILGPKDGKPVITPTQDMILGIYYLTCESKTALGTGTLFATFDEAFNACQMNKVHLHALIGISTNAFPKKNFSTPGILITTVGKLILNSALPEDFTYINQAPPSYLEAGDLLTNGQSLALGISNKKIIPAFNKGVLSKIINVIYDTYGPKVIPQVLDQIKDLGFEYSTKSSTTVSAFDVPSYDAKYELIKRAEQVVSEQKQYFLQGLLTEGERYRRLIGIWNKVKEEVFQGIKTMMTLEEYTDNSIKIMAESGARGNMSNFTQLSGMRGLMSKSYNYDQKSKLGIVYDVIESPIKHSFIEGLSVLEYFNSSYGARKGMTDTAMKTSKSGYMTRKLVDAAQEVIVKGEDCGTKHGLMVESIIDTRYETAIESLEQRLLNRLVNTNIYHPETGELIIGRNELISEAVIQKITDAKIQQVEVRSILFCQLEQGICQYCFGNDLTTRKLIAIGTTIGVIAAQSIGEPGTQLTMRTFHSGGVAGEANVAQGFERLKQLFDVIAPKEWERSVISEISGFVIEITTKGDFKLVTIMNDIDKRTYCVPINSVLRVELDRWVEIGDKITEGSIDINELLRISGINKARNYMIKEVQKVYKSQGIEIADKYIEIIIRQLTSKVQIQAPNDSKWLIHEIVDINLFRKECLNLLLSNKKPPTAINIVFGLDQVPAKSNSFLSSASFQDTKKILIDAAIKGDTDCLYSLKENVIMGNLIPAGTGLKEVQEVLKEAEKLGRFNY